MTSLAILSYSDSTPLFFFSRQKRFVNLISGNFVFCEILFCKQYAAYLEQTVFWFLFFFIIVMVIGKVQIEGGLCC